VSPGLPPFDAYNACIHNLPSLPVWQLGTRRQDCFKQTVEANHLALPAGTTAEQAYAKYDACLNQNLHTVSIGSFALGGYDWSGSPIPANIRQQCFTNALQ
jgi:hypothetical protein